MHRALLVGLVAFLTISLTPISSVTAQEPDPTEAAKPWSPVGKPRGYRWREFKTDFSKHSIPYDDIKPGGPSKNDIRSIDHPKRVAVEQAEEWLEPHEPVVVVERAGEAVAYPIRILIWHEIVNDTVGGVPVAITYGPLSNSAVAFERSVAGRVLEFGVTGRVLYGNTIMYDRETETWWQQATGEAFAGELTGARLSPIPAAQVSWSDFAAAQPNGGVLSLVTGVERQYGTNPYEGYDSLKSSFLYKGPETPATLPALARILTVELNGEAVGYPYAYLEKARVVNDIVGGTPIVVFWKPGTASPLDASQVAEGADVGSATAFAREVDDAALTFVSTDGTIRDAETGSEWDILGRATTGVHAGARLRPTVAVNHFWFSWSAFRPDARLHVPDDDSALTVLDATDGPSAAPKLKLDLELTLFQGAEQVGGETVRLSDLLGRGKPVVLNLLAGLCPACRVELPLFQATADRHGGDLLVVGIDVGVITGLGTRDDAIRMLRRLNITFPVGGTNDPKVFEEYGIHGMPGTIFFKPDGEVLNAWTGPLSADLLSSYVDQLLAKQEE